MCQKMFFYFSFLDPLISRVALYEKNMDTYRTIITDIRTQHNNHGNIIETRKKMNQQIPGRTCSTVFFVEVHLQKYIFRHLILIWIVVSSWVVSLMLWLKSLLTSLSMLHQAMLAAWSESPTLTRMEEHPMSL